jgi:hypothetical protein
MSEKLICCDFEKPILVDDQQPEGFQEWCEDITHDNCKVILPDNSSYDIRMFVDLNNNFNSGNYTTFLKNRFKELSDE